MLKVVALGLVAFLAAQIPLAAQASTVTFDLTLNNSLFGPTNGTGTLQVNGPLSSGLEMFSYNNVNKTGDLTSLSITLNNGQDFTLQQALDTTSATFNDGNLTSLSYDGAMNGYKLDLDTKGLFYLYVDASNWTLTSAGSISAVNAPSVAPLPSSSISVRDRATWTRPFDDLSTQEASSSSPRVTASISPKITRRAPPLRVGVLCGRSHESHIVSPDLLVQLPARSIVLGHGRSHKRSHLPLWKLTAPARTARFGPHLSRF